LGWRWWKREIELGNGNGDQNQRISQGEIEADTEFAGTVEVWRDAPTSTHVLLFKGAGSSSGQTTKHTAVVSPMTKSATHLCSDLYAVPPLLNGKGGLRKSFAVLRQLLFFGFHLEGLLLRDNQIAFWHL
jgi:hypothetical protein